MSAPETEVIEGQAVETVPEQSNASSAIAVVPTVPTLAVTPQVEAKELVARMDVIRQAMETAMVRDVDYGVIPGTGSKPALLKPGSEKLGVLFQLDIQIRNAKRWGPGDHLTVESQATVFHAPSGARLGFGEGICSTREKKYAKRRAQRKCPDCGQTAVFESKKADEGFFCWKKKGGCGHQFERGDQRITSQEEGEIENPDLPDAWNTVVKMAEKRARVDAVLAVTGASALFTQDVDENVDASATAAAPAERPKATAKAQPAEKSARPITAPQKGKIHALCGAVELTRVQASCLRRWWCVKAGADHFDRLPSTAASELIEALGEDGSGAIEILKDLEAAAKEGNEIAHKLCEELHDE